MKQTTSPSPWVFPITKSPRSGEDDLLILVNIYAIESIAFHSPYQALIHLHNVTHIAHRDERFDKLAETYQKFED